VSRADGNDNIRITSTQGPLNGVIYAPATGMALSAGSEISVPRVVCANLSPDTELDIGSHWCPTCPRKVSRTICAWRVLAEYRSELSCP
jgi:hypothetical protein